MLVLSLFPGIGLLDMAFEEEGFCVVRGPDLLWGGDIRRFHPLAGKFDGVIGGSPCQAFSQANVMGRLGRQLLADDLIPEFERIVHEAAPQWFVMENVTAAPLPLVRGYWRDRLILNNRWLGEEQNRLRSFTWGSREDMSGRSPWLNIEVAALENPSYAPCVTANGAQWDSRRARRVRGVYDDRSRSRSDRSIRALGNYIRQQGLPTDFLSDAPLTVAGKVRVVGNGVPLPMGRAIAKAIKKALQGAAS